ncbi:MAG: hypothetical protein BGO74_13945 [Burkholderiales bacterium 68-12]|nr:MAG: hypothetical protein BGO74_13945 [Burkholderiales bacterium 68-12]
MPARTAVFEYAHHVGIQADIDVFFRPGQGRRAPFGLEHFALGIAAQQLREYIARRACLGNPFDGGFGRVVRCTCKVTT